MKDKFDEMYLKLSGANNFYKKGLHSKALSIYLDIIENYYPDKDEPYRNACAILIAEKNYFKAKLVADKALKAFDEDNIRGDKEYFKEVLSVSEDAAKAEAKENRASKTLNILESKITSTISGIFLVLAVLLSLPDKLNKLVFLIFIIVSLILVFEIIKDISKNVKVTFKAAIFALFIGLTLVAGYNIPKEDWSNFFSIRPLNYSNSSTLENNPSLEEEEDKEKKNESGGKIVREDLDKLEKYSLSVTGLESYLLRVNEDRIFLRVNVANGTGKNEAKKIAVNLLRELNRIKNFEGEEGKIGDLYNDYSVTVKAYEGAVMIYSAVGDFGDLVEQ